MVAAATDRAADRALGLGEWAVSTNPTEVLSCLGLGSCVAVAVHDPAVPVAGMAHMVLPDSTAGRASAVSPAKFVDLAVPLLLDAMEEAGADRSRIQVDLVGGASMLGVPGRPDTMQIGERNAAAARTAITSRDLALRGEHLGGTQGRTVRLEVGTGRLAVTTAGSTGGQKE